jgi:ribonuclease Z
MKQHAGALIAVLVISFPAAGQTPQPPASNAPLQIVVLGSGGTPQADAQRYGPAILVEAAGEKLLFDCGRATVVRMAQAGVVQQDIDKIFLTHLHSDHILSVPDLLLTGWTSGRRTPLRVWGPTGTARMMRNMLKTFDFDIHLRRDVDEKFSKEGITVMPTDIQEGVVYEHNGVRVTAFLVDHGPVKPAFGYRVDAAGHSVVMSGDTRVSENLIKHATGVDVLIHEVFTVPVEALMGRGQTRQQAENIISHHTSAEETGIVFSRTHPRLAVYAHGGGPGAIAGARRNYSGPIETADDLMTILVGDSVEVRRRAAPRAN